MAKCNYLLQDVLPHDDAAEVNVLGSIMARDELFTHVEDVLTTDAFYGERNRFVFRLFKYILSHGQVIDENSVIACAEKFNGKTNISVDEVRYALMEIAVSNNISAFYQDVERIVEYGMRRKAWELLQTISKKVVTLTENSDDAIGEALKGLDVIRGSVNADSGIIDSKAAVKMVYDQINDNLSGVNKASVKTGYKFTDSKGGLRLGSVLIIGAWTSVGKSALALNISVNVAASGVPVAYYSLEMGAVELWARIVSGYTSISAGKILNYPLRRDEVATIDRQIDNLGNIPLYIDDKATTKFSRMLRSVRTMVKKYGIKMFVVDYLQIFAQNNKGGNEESVIGSMARELKNICRELNIICICLSQLRRDKDERHPTIDMLRGSGQIEESADNIVLIDRPDAHPEWGVQSFHGGKSAAGMAELRVCKGRNIGLGLYYVGFESVRTQFYELDGYKIGDDIGYDDGSGRAPVVEKKEDMPFDKETDNKTPF